MGRPGPSSSLVHHFERRGVDLFWEVCARDKEGIVAKLANAPYTPESILRRTEGRSSSIHECMEDNALRLPPIRVNVQE
jgi:hypothetical protein